MAIDKQNIKQIQQQILEYQKDNKNITLVAVTKTRTTEDIEDILSAGITHIAENKVQEIEKKFSIIKRNCIKHMVGRLQSNKVKKTVQLCSVIQSVDSLKLAELINKEAKIQNKIQQIMIQVNIGNEQQKGGVSVNDVSNLFEQILNLQNVKIIGIMCIAQDIKIYGEQEVRNSFRKMKQLFDMFNQNYNAKLQQLSMGMSDDYLIALEEGSTMIRIGRKLFE
jgi:pyridoxal phosphate enzyme (YggS family)